MANYNAADNTNPGFTTGNNVPGQVGGISVNQGNGFDIVQWIHNMAQQMNTPAQANASQGGMAVAPSQQIMQDVATKAYTKNMQQHAESTPPQILAKLIDSWGQQGGGQVPETNQGASSNNMIPPETPAGALRPIVVGPQQAQQSQSNQPQKAKAEPMSVDQQIEQINKQSALNVTKRNFSMSKDPNFMQRFNQNFTKMTGGVTQAEQLTNMGTIQKIAGAEPLQNKDIADLTAGTYKAGIEATHQALAVEGQRFTGLEELYSKLDTTKGRINQALATPSDEQKTVYKSLQATAKNINTHVSNLGMLINNRPKFSNQGVDVQAKNTADKVRDGQTATNPKTGAQVMYKGGKWIPAAQQ